MDKILFKKYWKRRWFKVLVITIFIALFIAIIQIVLSIVDSQKTRDMMTEDHNGLFEEMVAIKEGIRNINTFDNSDEKSALSKKEYDLGMTFLRLGDKNKAKEHFYNAIEFETFAPDSWYLIGEMQFTDDKNYPEALNSYLNGLERCDNFFQTTIDNKRIKLCWDLYLVIADTYKALGNYSEAKKWIQKLPLEYYEVKWYFLPIEAEIHKLNNECKKSMIDYSQFIKYYEINQNKWEPKGDKLTHVSDAITNFCECKYRLNPIGTSYSCDYNELLNYQI